MSVSAQRMIASRTVATPMSYLRELSGPVLLALVPSAVIIGLLVFTIWTGFQTDLTQGTFTLAHYRALFSDRLVLEAVLTTLKFAATAVAIAMLVGGAMAWIVECTDFRGKGLVYSIVSLGVLVPGFFTAMGWLFLLHPRSGIINRLAMETFGLAAPPLNIVSAAGMGFVQGLGLAPVAFVMLAAAMKAMDSSLHEAAQVSGASPLRILRRITLPLLMPAVLGAASYILVIAISAFDVPAIIGLSNRVLTFSTYLAMRIYPGEGLPEYGVAGAFSTFMILLALVLSWQNTRILTRGRRYQVVTGKNYRPHLIPLSRWRPVAVGVIALFILLGQVLPLAILAWSSLLPFLQMPSSHALELLGLDNFRNLPWPLVLRGFSHSIVIAVIAPTIAMATGLIFSWVILRSKSRLRLAFDSIAFLPHAVPSMIFAVAALILTLYGASVVPGLYGSLSVLVTVIAITQVSFATRVITASLVQMHVELEEAAYVCGASLATVVRRILGPLLRPAFAYGWLWLAMLALRELTVSVLLMSPQNLTVPGVVYTLLTSGSTGQASAVAIMMIAVLCPLVVIYLRLAGGARSPSSPHGAL